jgi:sulfotransferase 6B1
MQRILRRGRAELHALVHSARHRSLPAVVVNSLPKAGTNLLARTVSLLGFVPRGHLDIGPHEGLRAIESTHLLRAKRVLRRLGPGLFATAHLFHCPQLAELIRRADVRMVTIIRDPRDVCVSDAFYIAASPTHRLHDYYSGLSPDERLLASIVGIDSLRLSGQPPSLDIGAHYRSYAGWLHEEGLVVRFEDLIGSRGGGDDARQQQTVAAIAAYLGVSLERARLRTVSSDAFSPDAPTFRAGQVGSWHSHFKGVHRAAFDRVTGSVTKDFGYDG